MLDVFFTECGYGKCCYADCHIAERPFINLFPSVVMQNVTTLIHIFIAMLSVNLFYCCAECHIFYCYADCHILIAMLSVKLFNCCAECHIFIVMLSVTF
jgi:hypothetical protein